MDLPRIVVTDGDGNLIPLDNLPDAVRDLILSKAAERVKRNEVLKEPSARELMPLMKRLSDYAEDPRAVADRGPSPLSEELNNAVKTLILLRSVHRDIILRISSDEDALPTKDEKLSFATWVRDEAILNSAIATLEGALD